MTPALGFLAEALWTALHPSTLLLGAVAFLFFADFHKRRSPKNYPPGPPRLPFLGNFFHLDVEKGHLALQRVGESKSGWPGPHPDLKDEGHSGYPGREDLEGEGSSDAKAGTRVHPALSLVLLTIN